MKVKEKPCKAIGKAIASDIKGCGKSVLKRTYGLCDGCYKDWLFNTPEGKEKQKQNLPKCGECGERFIPFHNNSLQKYCIENEECIQAQVKHAQEQEIKKAEREKNKYNVDSMSAPKYWSIYIQPIVNNIARLIDEGQPCIGTGKPAKKKNGGHYHSVGSNLTLSLNLHNIHLQSEHSNNHKGGDSKRYRHNLIKVYTPEYADYIDMFLMQCPELHLTKDDLIELKPRLNAIKRRLDKLGMIYPAKVRMRLRDEINQEINIYQDEFASFEEYSHNKLSNSL